MEQESPCCAAAVVAGCLNSLGKIRNTNSRCITPHEILDIYANIFLDKIYEYENKFINFDELLKLIDTFLANNLNKKHKIICKKIKINIYQEIKKIDKFFVGNYKNFKKFYLKNTHADFKDNILLLFGQHIACQKYNCLLEFKRLLMTVRNFKMLTKDRPSTAPIGNWGIYKSINLMNIKLNLIRPIIVENLINMDELNNSDYLWQKLKSKFIIEESIIIFHLKNHYSLIYALKEVYNPETNNIDKLILISKKGQSPKDWVMLDYIIETLKKWKGYALICVNSSTDIANNILTRKI
jgi:hypothetical protein